MNKLKQPLAKLTFVEQLNFLLTNRIPRRLLTRFMGWFSKIQNRPLARVSIWVWQLFADDMRLHEATTQEFNSVHECFTRELKAGMRPICTEPDVLVSPCDAVVGEFGDVEGLRVFQAKGFPYTLDELLENAALAEEYRHGRFVTLRLKSSMYHHFHAPCDGQLGAFTYISGDTWNVNPIALKKVEKLFCRNERAVVKLQTENPAASVTLVPVAAVLVASLRFRGLSEPLNLQYRGPNEIKLERQYVKGEDMGYFEHGSTIILLTSKFYSFCEDLCTGKTIRMGQPLMKSVI